MTVPNSPNKPLLSSGVYDWLKRSAIVVLPALGTLYFTIAQIWGLPKAEEVVGTIAAVNVFVGIVVQLSNRSYNKSDVKYDGTMDITEKPDGTKVFMLNVAKNPDVLETQNEIVLKVNNG